MEFSSEIIQSFPMYGTARKKMGLMLVLISGSVKNMVSYLDRDGENEKNINRLSAAILDFLFSFTPYQG